MRCILQLAFSPLGSCLVTDTQACYILSRWLKGVPEGGCPPGRMETPLYLALCAPVLICLQDGPLEEDFPGVHRARFNTWCPDIPW